MSRSATKGMSSSRKKGRSRLLTKKECRSRLMRRANMPRPKEETRGDEEERKKSRRLARLQEIYKYIYRARPKIPMVRRILRRLESEPLAEWALGSTMSPRSCLRNSMVL